MIVFPVLLNAALCCAFVLARRPMPLSWIEERERAARGRTLLLASGDPFMIIADRPLRQWDSWHGGEALWVKSIEVLDGPALLVTKMIYEVCLTREMRAGALNYTLLSWRAAYLFLSLSSIEWLAFGVIVGRHIRR